MNLYDLITESQIIQITDIIRNQCRLYDEKERAFENLFYDRYMKMRKKHDLTGAVISGFRTEKTKIDGLVISEIKYGIGYWQPEIKNNNTVIHIYSDTNNLKSNIIKQYCKKYNSDLETCPLYAFIIYKTNEYQLEDVTLVVPDSNGVELERFVLYKKTKVIVISA